MCNVSLCFYFIAINLFSVLVLYINYIDIFTCYACQEMDSLRVSFDYIVVGSGSAGSIVARRLAEDKKVSVLLLEAGSTGNGVFDIPSFGLLLQQSVFDWQYKTEPQEKACLGLDNKASLWPMGKILGGTSKLNNMIYVRGHPKDYSNWYKHKTDYTYEKDILPYFRKLEYSLDDRNNASRIINDPPFVSNLAAVIMDAAKSLNFPILNSLESKEGFSIPKATVFHGQRWTPSHKLRRKKNLVIRTNVMVQKVLFKDNLKAYGVRYSHLNAFYQARARRGVILSAGVIGTPKILMLSGIGPKDHLKDVKIDVKLDLPVGEHLQDHVATGFDLVLLNKSLNVGYQKLLSPIAAVKYLAKSQGPFGTIGCDNIAFFDTKKSGSEPDLQFMVIPLGVSNDHGVHLRKLVGIGEKLWEKYFGKIKKTAISILPIVLHPKSRGYVRLRDSDPETAPRINPRYLSDSHDVEILLEGIEMIKKLLQTDAMKKLSATLNPNLFPGCEAHVFDTKPYWECYVRQLTMTVYHPVGTCQMGEVVDYNFRVKGTTNLYVVDGSILPSLPTGNPNGAIMMMAEKAADVLKSLQGNEPPKETCDKRDMLVMKTSCS